MRRIRPTLTAHYTIARTLAACAFAVVAGASCGGGDSTAVVPVSALRFTAQPTSIAAGVPFSVTVELVSAAGARVTSAVDPVTITVLGGGTISGPASVAAVGGVAKFDGLSMNTANPSVQLAASDGLLTSSSAAFAVSPGAADLTRSAVAPAPCTTGPNVPMPLTFTFKDAFGNVLPSAAVTLASSLPSATFAPAAGTTTATGTFATTFTPTALGSATVTATVAGKALTFAPAFVIASAPSALPMAFPGTVTGTISSSVCAGTGLPAAVYSFTMPAQGGAGFTVTSAFTPVFEVKPGPGLGDVQVTNSTTPVTVEWILPAGPLQFTIGTLAGVGAYTVTGASVPANSGCQTRVLIAGGTYTGQTLATGDCNDFYGDGSFSDEYFMQSPGPCTITVRTTAFDNYFAIYDAATGTPVGGSHPAMGVDAVVPLTTCQSGSNPIDIVVNSFNAGETGPYTLIVVMQGSGPRAGITLSPPAKPMLASSRGLVRLLRAAGTKHTK